MLSFLIIPQLDKDICTLLKKQVHDIVVKLISSLLKEVDRYFLVAMYMYISSMPALEINGAIKT